MQNFKSLQYGRSPNVPAAAACREYAGSERLLAAEAEIEAMRSDGVHANGGIANERRSGFHEIPGIGNEQWIDMARAGDANSPQLQPTVPRN